jgi:hypothetical protein
MSQPAMARPCQRSGPATPQAATTKQSPETFAGQIIETGTHSYRLAHARQQQNAKNTTERTAR